MPLLLKIVLEVLARVTGQEKEKQGTQTDSTTVTSYNGPWEVLQTEGEVLLQKERRMDSGWAETRYVQDNPRLDDPISTSVHFLKKQFQSFRPSIRNYYIALKLLPPLPQRNIIQCLFINCILFHPVFLSHVFFISDKTPSYFLHLMNLI